MVEEIFSFYHISHDETVIAIVGLFDWRVQCTMALNLAFESRLSQSACNNMHLKNVIDLITDKQNALVPRKTCGYSIPTFHSKKKTS